MTPPHLRCPALAALANIRHGFFTRQGGVSEGLYASLNCGPGSADDPAAVAENRRRIAAALDVAADRLTTLHQVHGRTVVEAAAPLAERPRADGVVTREPGLALGILTADCVPVLLAAPAAGVIGACHAGWKGALAGIAEATVEAMAGLGAVPAEITATVGPAIAQASYEVGDDLRRQFVAVAADHDRFFQPGDRPGHHQFDLPGFVASRLRAAGIGRVHDLGEDTRDQPDRFFSYRRTTLRGEADYGRQISVIALAP